jgi:hypothetical protein
VTDPETPAGRGADDDYPNRSHGGEEEIDEAGDETFPASDAPQWWAGEPDGDGDGVSGDR